MPQDKSIGVSGSRGPVLRTTPAGNQLKDQTEQVRFLAIPRMCNGFNPRPPRPRSVVPLPLAS